MSSQRNTVTPARTVSLYLSDRKRQTAERRRDLEDQRQPALKRSWPSAPLVFNKRNPDASSASAEAKLFLRGRVYHAQLLVT
jgi:hypothetical protein